MAISKKDIERFKELDLKAFNMYNEGMSIATISKELGVKRQSLSKRLKEKYDLEILPNGKKKIDSNYFNSIDSEEKAYWLGFLFADGYISSTNKIELSLKESDKDHILKFKESIKSNHAINKKKNILNGKTFYSYRISIADSNLSKNLKELGCINNKSLTCKFPLLNEELVPSFIRGFFDGDGSFYFDNRYNKMNPRCEFSCGSIDFINKLKEILKGYYGIDSNLYADRNIYSLRISGKDNNMKFLDLIYKNATIKLDRKYELYTHMPS